MIGLVLWCDADDGKAVFWCEDHGDLAYYDGALDGIREPLALLAGDMVEFSTVADGNIRRAQNACLVSARVCDDIQGRVRRTAAARRKPQAKDENVVSLDSFRKTG